MNSRSVLHTSLSLSGTELFRHWLLYTENMICRHAFCRWAAINKVEFSHTPPAGFLLCAAPPPQASEVMRNVDLILSATESQGKEPLFVHRLQQKEGLGAVNTPPAIKSLAPRSEETSRLVRSDEGSRARCSSQSIQSSDNCWSQWGSLMTSWTGLCVCRHMLSHEHICWGRGGGSHEKHTLL